MGSDSRNRQNINRGHTISIHAPRVGSDTPITLRHCTTYLFLSTLPAWGATRKSLTRQPASMYFYPRSPRGERPLAPKENTTKQDFYPRSPRGERLVAFLFQVMPHNISIHAPRVGSDRRPADDKRGTGKFLSTLPAWGATSPATGMTARFIFLSTLPAWGATVPSGGKAGQVLAKFLSTLPAWGATSVSAGSQLIPLISIHAPRVGSDFLNAALSNSAIYFYPRSPRGERPGISTKGKLIP